MKPFIAGLFVFVTAGQAMANYICNSKESQHPFSCLQGEVVLMMSRSPFSRDIMLVENTDVNCWSGAARFSAHLEQKDVLVRDYDFVMESRDEKNQVTENEVIGKLSTTEDFEKDLTAVLTITAKDTSFKPGAVYHLTCQEVNL